MNVYRISQRANNEHDTYDSAVVVAASVDAARHVHPCRSSNQQEWWGRDTPWFRHDWAHPDDVDVDLIARLPGDSPLGEGEVICASFNAG